MNSFNQTINQHIFDQDGTCLICGFDGAEFHHWKTSTYEGKASPEVKQPECKTISQKEWNTYKDRQDLEEDFDYYEDFQDNDY